MDNLLTKNADALQKSPAEVRREEFSKLIERLQATNAVFINEEFGQCAGKALMRHGDVEKQSTKSIMGKTVGE